MTLESRLGWSMVLVCVGLAYRYACVVFLSACGGVVRCFQLADSVAPIYPSLSIPMKYVQKWRVLKV
jgi:hypothetical protein